MPKTEAEDKTLRHFKQEYKDPEKAKRIYYSLRNKNKKFDRSQGGGFSAKSDWWSERWEKLPKEVRTRLSRVLIG
jgi:hypothetical protein